jgi:ribosomal protein S18 acetylase RimI-like enzyme
MTLNIRNSNYNDLDKIYDLHKLCFNYGDLWYKHFISLYIDNGIVITDLNTNNIIAVLLQGDININEDLSTISYKSSNGLNFLSLQKFINPGIVMLCVHPSYRNKGLARKLINKHFLFYSNKTVCLNVRKSNINAYNLYINMGYEHILTFENKYFNPTEDSYFLIKKIL